MEQKKYLKWYNKIGYGSHACGPALPEQYEIPRKGKNTFRFVF